MTCESFREHAAELALGVLPGGLRAEALAHAAACTACAALLRDLTEAADALGAAAPEADPPAGFEGKVLARISGEQGQARPWWYSRQGARTLALAAAAAAFATGAGLVAAAGHAGAHRVAAVRAAAVTGDGGRAVGAALAVDGPRVFVGVDMTTDTPNQTYRVVVDEMDGRSLSAGTAQAVGRTCTWAWMLPVGAGQLKDVRMLPVGGAGSGYVARFARG